MDSSASSIHRPRKKKKVSAQSRSDSTQNTIVTDSKTNSQSPAFPLVSFLWPTKKSTSQWIVLPLILMVVGLFRWATGFWGYSGFQTPPMHGDFEAQRHWMEIAIHLPMSQWYFYDLPYWGLDYPPLTAYHSWVLGKLGSIIDPKWFEFDSSRGFESQLLKVYMRATVLISEYITYIPAAIIFNRRFSRLGGVNVWESSIALVAVLMQPATILIDHAHFQYNTVMLGFVLASMSSMLAGRLLWGCIFFTAALCFKQMALYFAPAIFAYLLGLCLLPKLNILRFTAIALVTIASFAFIFTPLLLGSLYDTYRRIPLPASTNHPPLISSLPISLNQKASYYPLLLTLSQSLHRIFPFSRGLFEDKVANFWCSLHTVHKLTIYSLAPLRRISLLCTLASILPACMTISLFPLPSILPYALASCAWGFFLFSFQVHEKSVLLPLLPMTILLGGGGGLSATTRAWVGWANMLGAWTLFPLLKRDELRVPYAVLTILWAYILGLPPTSLALYTSSSSSRHSGGCSLLLATKLLHLSFYAAMLAWHILEAAVVPPTGKPDLWVVINVVVGAAGFAVCWLWCTWQLIVRSGVLEDYFGVRVRLERLGREGKVYVRVVGTGEGSKTGGKTKKMR